MNNDRIKSELWMNYKWIINELWIKYKSTKNKLQVGDGWTPSIVNQKWIKSIHDDVDNGGVGWS